MIETMSVPKRKYVTILIALLSCDRREKNPPEYRGQPPTVSLILHQRVACHRWMTDNSLTHNFENSKSFVKKAESCRFITD